MNRDKIDLLLDLDMLSHNYLVELNQNEMEEFLARDVATNDYDPDKVREFVKSLSTYADRWQVGRESKRVICFHARNTAILFEMMRTRTPNTKESAFANEVEVNRNNSGGIVARFWWD